MMKVTISSKDKYERGAVSLFVVVFVAMLITVVTVSFIRIMVRDQQQATAVDLSQSAYDSAQAGVEDAKRAFLRYETVCGDASLSAECTAAKKSLELPQSCNESLSGIVTPVDGEVKIQQTTGDSTLNLDQAYTCVKIFLQTPDYKGVLSKDESKLIPLKGVSGFDTISLNWFSQDDLKSGTNTVDAPQFSSGTPLLSNANWMISTAPNRPPVLRAQLIQFSSSGFTLSDFDGGYNASTVFLYPSTIGSTTSNVSLSSSRSTPSAPAPVHCDAILSSGGYACSVNIVLPDPVGGTAATRTAYLNLSSLYRGTNYQIKLSSGGVNVDFDSVEPEVDSTGRANDLFRRVSSRIETVQGTYPTAAVSVSGNLCKNFSVTDTVVGYNAGSDCTP